jgi:hypothetical protein
MIMPSPTATSAAATAITKITIICPDIQEFWWSIVGIIGDGTYLAKAKNVRFTAFSMSSTHMNTITGFRRTTTPTAPVRNMKSPTAK